MHQVTGHRADHRGVRQTLGADPVIVLDLGRCRVDDGHDGDGLGVLAWDARAGQHHQVGSVAAHARREMIEAEQALQSVGILFVALQPVDQRELLIHQRAIAPRQRLEHVGHLHLQPRLLGRQKHRLLVQFVDGVGDLADLLRRRHRQRRDRGCLAVEAGLLDLPGQILVGHLQRAVPQRAQRPHQAARHQRDQQERDQQHRADDRGVADRGGPGGCCLVGDRRGDRPGRIGDDPVGDATGDALRRQQVRVVRQCHARVREQRHPLDHLRPQRRHRVGGATEERTHCGHRRRFRAGQRDHRRAQFGLGQICAAVDEHLLHRHLAAGTDRPRKRLARVADRVVVSRHQAGDRSLGGDQQGRVRHDPGTQIVAARRALADEIATEIEQRVRRQAHRVVDIGRAQLALQIGSPGLEGGDARGYVTAVRRAHQHRFHRGQVLRDLRHHLRPRCRDPQRLGGRGRGVDA